MMRPLHDKCKGHHPVPLLDMNKLAFTAKANESILFMRKGKLIALSFMTSALFPPFLTTSHSSSKTRHCIAKVLGLVTSFYFTLIYC